MSNTDYIVTLTLKAQNEATQEIEKLNGQVSSIGKVIGGRAVGKTLLTGVKSFSDEVLTLGGNLEQAEVAFTTMLGSGEEANKMLKDLTDFAKKTPFELTGIRESAKQMLAMGIESDKLLPTMKALGDVSAGLGVDLSRLSYNFGQVKSQGHLTGTELRDFTKMGIPLVNQLATSLGKSEVEIQKMVSAGEIGFDVVEKAFIDMTSEGGKFENLMEKQSGTYQGMMSNLQDSFNSIKETLGRTFIPILEKVLDKLNPLIEKFSDRVEANPELATTLATVIAGAIALVGALSGLGAIIPIITAGFTVLTGPIGMVAGAIALLATARINDWGGIRETTAQVVDRISEIVKPWLDKLSERRDKWGGVVIEVVKGLWSFVEDIFVSAFEILGTALENFFKAIDVIVKIFSGDREGAWEGIKEMTTNVRDTMMKVIDNLFGDALDRLADKLTAFGTRISNARTNIKNTVLSIATAIRDGLKSGFEFRIAIFTGDRETAYGIADQRISSLDTMMTAGFGQARTNIKAGIQQFYDDVVAKFTALKNKVKEIVDSIKNAWNSAKDAVGGAAKKARDFVSSPFKAGGGDVYGGQSYIVGERGPELFVPKQNGSVIPTNQVTNNNGIEINISGVNVRNENDINQLADEIVRRIKLEKNFGIA